MSYRSLVAAGALAVTMAFALTVVPVAGQTRSTPATAAPVTKAPAPKTAWGEPDLQGIWTYEYQVPFQRPEKYKDREFFTDAEITQLDKQRAAQQSRDYRAERGSEADVAGA